MTLDEFLIQLSNTKDKYEWVIFNRNEIRGKLKNVSCECCRGYFCPITAVIKEMTQASYIPMLALQSAKQINLSEDDASDIVRSADAFGVHSCNLRDKLAKAVGLEL